MLLHSCNTDYSGGNVYRITQIKVCGNVKCVSRAICCDLRANTHKHTLFLVSSNPRKLLVRRTGGVLNEQCFCASDVASSICSYRVTRLLFKSQKLPLTILSLR
jgi:hypothetical protein